MILLIDRSFEKDAKNFLLKFNRDLNAEKLSGSKDAYRIRLGNYRIGIYKEDNKVILSRVLNRKEIYRYFPKK